MPSSAASFALSRPSGFIDHHGETTMNYALPTVADRPTLAPNTAYLITSGDLREPANRASWAKQLEVEASLEASLRTEGWSIVRATEYDPAVGHGLISSQRRGIAAFSAIPLDAPLIVAVSSWQYSHHVLAGLRSHRGPILTVANFSGTWPGLVGLLNLNGSLTKAGVSYSTLWSADFTDEWFLNGINAWISTGEVAHDATHVRALPQLPASPEVELGRALAAQLKNDKAILGVFDEGCMGMYNAIIDDELLNPLGLYKERLSQSALWAEMLTVPDEEADAVDSWVRSKGMTFLLGTDEATELTESQLRWQYKMYIAALRIGDDFGVDSLGIQYQQGLKDICPASDLAEGLLNNVDRPPVTSRDGSRILWEGAALPHFNEADEGAAVDALITNRIWVAMGLDPATTLHDVRWGKDFGGQFVWTFEISGAVPPSHLVGGYAGAQGMRQNPLYFPLGGSTIKGLSRPGELVWSRVFVEGGSLHVDLGRGSAIELPAEETERRWQATNPEWPIMHAVLHGVTRDQFMGRHKANHVNVAYATDEASADAALMTKAAMFAELGVQVHLCGDVRV
jgi:hypothetical protein